MEKKHPLSDAEIHANELKEFVYIISHDLGAPLRGMVEFSKLLKEEQPDALNEDGKLYLSFIIDNGVKLQTMLAALLDYSRLNTEAQPFSKVSGNLILKDCVAALKDKINSKKGKLEIPPLPDITGDIAQIRALFLALLDNALTYHAPDVTPHVRFSVEENADGSVFSVQDNGIGMDPKFHQQIFKVFRRLHSDAEYPGVGMGLALAKKIVERHKGKIWVEPSGTEGSIFKFTLPRAS